MTFPINSKCYSNSKFYIRVTLNTVTDSGRGFIRKLRGLVFDRLTLYPIYINLTSCFITASFGEYFAKTDLVHSYNIATLSIFHQFSTFTFATLNTLYSKLQKHVMSSFRNPGNTSASEHPPYSQLQLHSVS
jgi:hypothetical protein